MQTELTGALTTKIGPLPGYAYVIIGVGGVFAFRKFRSKNDTGGYVPTSMAAGETPAPAGIAPANDQPLPSNQQWALQAAKHLRLTTSYGASEISTALYNYLTGTGLSSYQESIVNAALISQGFPSEGLLPVYNADPINYFTNMPYVPEPVAPAYSDPIVNQPYIPPVSVEGVYTPPPIIYDPPPYVPPVVVVQPYVPPVITLPPVDQPYIPTGDEWPGFINMPYVNLQSPRSMEDNVTVTPVAGVTYNPTQNADRNYDNAAYVDTQPAYIAPVAPVVTAPTQGTVDTAGIA